MRRLFAHVLALALIVGLGVMPMHAEAKKAEKKEKASAAAKVDINTASQAKLESLPGIGPAIAGRIIGERPFKSLQDLERVGLSDSEIKKLKGKAKAGRSSGETASSSRKNDERKASDRRKSDKESASNRDRRQQENSQAKPESSAGDKVDINSASPEELEALPGVGEATAQKIIAGRPYRSKADLKKVGIPESTIKKIYPHVIARRADSSTGERNEPVTFPDRPRPESTSSDDTGSDGRGLPQRDVEAPDDEEVSNTPARTPPSAGMVWVNTDSGLFHREGDHWFGRTKEGKFMAESEALRAGYREAWSRD